MALRALLDEKFGGQYKLHARDGKCSSKALAKRNSGGALECKALCTDDEQCLFYALSTKLGGKKMDFVGKNWCETYALCDDVIPVDEEEVLIFKRL